MILEILLPFPINKTFSYLAKDELEKKNDPRVGSLVEVEFNSKKSVGLVVKINRKKSICRPLKKINRLLNPFILSLEIIESINFIADYSCNKRSMILKLFLSGFPKKIAKFETNKKNLKKKELKSNTLNLEQKIIVSKINNIKPEQFNVVLLEGVTGSGKTRVYMNKVKKLIESGVQCLVLVPEIILTTEWVREIKRDFDLNPVVYHSSIKRKEREKIWALINTNQIKFVIGTRSALFLPFYKLGLIVVDEEHDSSYKQEEQTIINARDFSIVRAMNSHCMVILSSATPSLESFHNVKLNKFRHFRLTKRVNNKNTPIIETIDMKKQKNLISDQLCKKIERNLFNNHQTLIFINKRGYAPLVICKKCGHSRTCENCNTSLVLHNLKTKSSAYLLCHHCNYKEIFENLCKNCKSQSSFEFPGLGIEKISEQISNLFPDARKCVLSSDTMNKELNLKTIVPQIISNDIDIIIGTQLVSKGHNFPFLKTVGILNVDYLLNDFDFRSFEKTFQQIIQVGGRAGRKNLNGEIVIQTMQPEHKVFELCKSKNMLDFFNWEHESRKKNQHPPFVNFISLIFSSKNEQSTILFSNKISDLLKNKFTSLGIFGPAPSIIYKLRANYRYRVLIKVPKLRKLQKELKKFLLEIDCPRSVKLSIDVDPLNFI